MKESRAERTARAVVHARATLLAGFTTTRDLGTEGAMYDDVGLKQAIEKGVIPGPHILCATRAIVATGSYGPKELNNDVESPHGAAEADGVEGITKEARIQIGKGADLIKVYADYRWGPNGESEPTFTIEELKKVVEVAASSGRDRCRSHRHHRRDAPCDRSRRHDDRTRRRWYPRAVCPHEVQRDRALPHAWPPAMPSRNTMVGGKGSTPNRNASGKNGRSFRQALAAGVTICMGGDVGVYPHGDNAREMEMMADYGMEPLDVLKSATSVNADVFGIAGKVGSRTDPD